MKGKRYFLWECLLGAFLLLLSACGSGQAGSSSEQTSNQQSSNQQPGGPSLVGMWSGNCTLVSDGFNTIEFRNDGTVILASNQVANYSVSGNQIQFSAGGYTAVYSYELSPSGNLLKLSDIHNSFCALARAGTNAVGELRQGLMGAWTISGQPCQSAVVYHLGGLSHLNFKSNQAVDVTTDQGPETDAYFLQDAGTVVFQDNIGNREPYSAWISGNTLTLQDNPGYGAGGSLCAFQKST